MDQTPSDSGSRRRGSRRRLWVIAGTAALLGLFLALTYWALGADSAEIAMDNDEGGPGLALTPQEAGLLTESQAPAEGPPYPTATTKSAPGDEGTNARIMAPGLPDPAADAMLTYIGESTSMSPPAEEEGEETATPDFSAFAAGPALGGLIAQYEELKDNGWVQRGDPQMTVVSGPEPLTVGQHEVQRVGVCIDSSSVEVVDQSGAIILAATEPGSRTALNFYDLQEHEGSWVVFFHSFPDDPTC
ncbi:hypothetical protein BN1051_00831 [Arthrobacter saudimassiliensis]|uniref:ARC6 IMS domain-containing protein n=1 Tax=Arthrobacter saudimassiliensis TaxID=1461584 RepID=A0A078MRP8_9MICC|nr:hypothetical protein BN1051_00831 [Arthrobacter saudimassiliensis]